MRVDDEHKRKEMGSDWMKIAICDDEKEMREYLSGLINRFLETVEVIQYENGEALLACEDNPDIIFLDILMPETKGMDVAKQLRERGSRAIIIFVTGVEEYVYQAFDVGAFHYLVKPIDVGKFQKVLTRAMEQLAESDRDENKREVIVKTRGITRRVRLEDIVYAEVFNRNIVLHLKDCQIEYYGKMKELEAVVDDRFYRTHRSYLVNLKYVSGYEAGKIYLGQETALLSKDKYAGFVREFLRYTRKR